MKIKICGINDQAALEAALEADVDAIGFVFAWSPRRVTPERAAELCRQVPARVARVAVTRHPSIELLKEILEVFDPDCLQSDAEDFKELEVRRGPLLIPVYREGVADPGLFASGREQRALFAPDFVYEGALSGQGQTVDWDRAAALAGRGRMLLAGGLDAENVGGAIHKVRPWGVDVSSGVESAPGQKDAQRVAAFVAAARAAETELNEEESS